MLSRVVRTAFSKRSKCCANVFRKELRLFPRGEVTADVVFLVIDEFGIGLFRPTLRRLIDLVRKGAYAGRDGNALHVEEAELIFPLQPGRRDRRLSQPVHRNVVENVVARKSARLSEKCGRDHFVTILVVIEDPSPQTNR